MRSNSYFYQILRWNYIIGLSDMNDKFKILIENVNVYKKILAIYNISEKELFFNERGQYKL